VETRYPSAFRHLASAESKARRDSHVFNGYRIQMVKFHERKSLGRQIYEQLLGSLQRGELSSADKLVDVALAEKIGVSRMPVREALSRLAHEGYLSATTRGFALPEISLDDAEEIFEMRKLLEPRAVASATPRLPPEAIDELGATHGQAGRALEAGDHDRFTDANRRFRQTWLQCVPNKRMSEAIQRLGYQTDVIRSKTFNDPSAQKVAFALMSEMLRAFRGRDALLAHDTMALLIEQGRERYVGLISAMRTSDETGEPFTGGQRV
jgi:DNA-binding GntR family transcriptional regulator